jgi:signal transduction histidine kinase
VRERARLAGGALQLVSEPDVGTTLTLRLPLEPEGTER